MHRDYKPYCDNPTNQHNIMALVGNGFDIAAFKKCGRGKMMDKRPTYADFFDYITYWADENELKNNQIYMRMKEGKKEAESKGSKDKTWSDFELIIDDLCRMSGIDLHQLRIDLDYIQDWFSKFLNDLISAETMIEINKEAMENQWADTTMSMFLGDLNGINNVQLDFTNKLNHYDIFNFLFVDFNYSMMLDNYLYLDRFQFDSSTFKTVDRNFIFHPAPMIPGNMSSPNCDTTYSSYLITEIVHPHGYMDIPRSMIFGTELNGYDKHGDERMFVKSHWARDDIRYAHYFDNTELFIIFGMAISKTDAWWFNNIYESLLKKNAELIIYNYCSKKLQFPELSDDEVKKRFIEACARKANDAKSDETVKRKIQIVNMTDNNTYFLGFKRK